MRKRFVHVSLNLSINKMDLKCANPVCFNFFCKNEKKEERIAASKPQINILILYMDHVYSFFLYLSCCFFGMSYDFLLDFCKTRILFVSFLWFFLNFIENLAFTWTFFGSVDKFKIRSERLNTLDLIKERSHSRLRTSNRHHTNSNFERSIKCEDEWNDPVCEAEMQQSSSLSFGLVDETNKENDIHWRGTFFYSFIQPEWTE